MMIAHQDDAIQLARLETGGGVNTDARALASRIEKSRAARITQMLSFLRDPITPASPSNRYMRVHRYNG